MWLEWTARVWLVVGNATALSFTIGATVLYGFILNDASVQIGLNQLGAHALTFFPPLLGASIAISIIHVLSLLHSLAPARRLFERVARLPRRLCTNHIVPSPLRILPEPIKATADTLTRRKTLAITTWSRYNAEITRLFMLWEIALQTFQAYKISHLVASVSINRLIAVVIVTNCWFSPILHYAMGNRPVAHVRLGRLLVDSSLDLVYNILIPLSILYPYYRDFIGSFNLYPLVFYYDDTWYVNAVSELRQVFVTSWFDFISKGSGNLALVYRLWKVQAAATEVTLANANRTDGLVSVRVKPRPSIPRPAADSATQPRQWYRSRLSRLLDLVLVLWGAIVFSLHLTATITSFKFYDPDCLLEMRPWGSLAYSCASFEISCSKRHTTGEHARLDAILTTVDPLSVQNLILSNCAELHVPTAIQTLQHLSMIKIYNSTIASWEGLLTADFPTSVWDIAVCITNISTFPSAITDAWENVGILFHEGNPEMTEFPDVLLKLPNLFLLRLVSNGIRSIGDGVLQNHHFVTLDMDANPIDTLPDSIGSLDRLASLHFVKTNIAEIPAAWMEIPVPASMAMVVLSAAQSPLCDSKRAEIVTKPAWLYIDCELPTENLYVYPIDEEDAWRRVNQ